MYKILTFNLAREALGYIVNKYKVKEMRIPYYLCEVVRHTLVNEGCKPVFYHIDNNFFPTEEFNKDDYILYPNYWGICGKNVNKLAEKYPNLIVDNAHAYYDKPSGFACFNAGHKFGYKESYLWLSDEKLKVSDNPEIKYDKDILIRKELFLGIHEKYKTTNLLNIDTDSIPFVYPYLAADIKDADNLVKILKKEGKIVYRYWHPLPKSFCEYKFYSKLVPIPILPY